MHPQQRSRLMRLSWQIQKRRQVTRSKALYNAWAIFLNEDIAVFHLVQKHSHDRYPNKMSSGGLTLF